MDDNLDLTKILKNAPKGMKLWSPVYGECTFINVDYLPNVMYPIHCQATNKDGKSTYVLFAIDGRIDINYKNSGCVLFPSKDNQDWSIFKVSNEHKHFEPYQKVLIKDKFCSKYFWVAALYSHYDTLTNKHYLVGSDWAEDEDIIPYEGNEDKVGKII